MALIHCDFFSEAIGVSSSMYVILPQETTTQIGMAGAASAGRHPTLFLLHGLSDDHTIWLRRTSIERYVAPLGLAVVMPAVHRSFYADMKRGYRYWTFISEELPALARSFFPLSDAREDTFHVAPLRRDVPIRDRTGGGDSFSSGVLAALLKGHNLETAVQWGAAHGILVQETPGDITMVDERLVLAEVKRASAGGGVKATR